MSTQYDELQGKEQNVLDHPDHNFSDRVQVAGEIKPFPIQQDYVDWKKSATQKIIDDAKAKGKVPGQSGEIIRFPGK